MTSLEKAEIELQKDVLGRCPVCSDILRTNEYLMYFIQKKVHTKYGEFYNRYRYVTLKELQEQYCNEPDCPEALKNAKDWSHLPFCSMRCARPVVAWLNTKEPDEYRYGSHYGLPRTKYENEDDEEDE